MMIITLWQLCQHAAEVNDACVHMILPNQTHLNTLYTKPKQHKQYSLTYASDAVKLVQALYFYGWHLQQQSFCSDREHAPFLHQYYCTLALLVQFLSVFLTQMHQHYTVCYSI